MFVADTSTEVRWFVWIRRLFRGYNKLQVPNCSWQDVKSANGVGYKMGCDGDVMGMGMLMCH
jgi:hypothetical protein